MPPSSFLILSVPTPRTLFNEIKNSKLTNFEYTWNLGKELAFSSNSDTRRMMASNHLLKEKMRRILGVVIVQNPIVPVQNAGHGICEQCRDQIQGEGYAAAKKKLNNKITEKCFQCGHFVCNKPMHRHSLCTVCKSAHLVFCKHLFIFIYVLLLLESTIFWTCDYFHAFYILYCLRTIGTILRTIDSIFFQTLSPRPPPPSTQDTTPWKALNHTQQFCIISTARI